MCPPAAPRLSVKVARELYHEEPDFSAQHHSLERDLSNTPASDRRHQNPNLISGSTGPLEQRGHPWDGLEHDRLQMEIIKQQHQRQSSSTGHCLAPVRMPSAGGAVVQKKRRMRAKLAKVLQCRPRKQRDGLHPRTAGFSLSKKSKGNGLKHEFDKLEWYRTKPKLFTSQGS
ncbi:hypothetical protein H920_07244 [Fukomys damarensis]|uniref:Uncharacterized protein n=1 Tax=Fukomys damarensis TaxID=885580 RepID=A0A091DGQ8_FUKDA|nr:hypothetical protein H920_07244 [Fukomys damarensis]